MRLGRAATADVVASGDRRRAVGWLGGARIALHAAARRPSLWPLALASFLFRGGIVLFILPIVVLPSTVGIATFVGPTTITPNGPAPAFLELVGSVVALVAGWVVLGGLVAATAEASLIHASLGGDASRRDESPPPARSDAMSAEGVTLGLASRMLAARSVSTLPLVLAVGWAIPRLVGATYDQLIKPSDPAIALPVRVLETVPDILAVILVAWLVSEAIGGVAVRRIALLREGVLEAVGHAVVHLATRPLGSLASVAVGLAFTVALVAPGLAVATTAWASVSFALDTGSAVAALLLTVVFVAVWATALLAAAVGATWRSVDWTVEVLRRRADAARSVPLLGGVGVLVEGEATHSAS